MDLQSLFASGTAVIEIKNPQTGEVIMDESTPPQPMTLTVMGRHTDQYKKMERLVGFDALKRNKKKDVEKMTAAEFEIAVSENSVSSLELEANTVVDCNIFMDGKKLKCNQKSIIELFSDERTSWIRVQFLEDMDKNELFFKS